MQCSKCGESFNRPGPQNTCPTCKAALGDAPDPAPGMQPQPAEQPPDAAPGFPGSPETRQAGAEKPGGYAPQYPTYRKPNLARAAPAPRQPLAARRAEGRTPASRPAQTRSDLERRENQRRDRPGRPVQAQGAPGLAGSVVRVDALAPEPPDRIWAQVLFSVLFFVDLVLVLGWAALLVLAVFLALWVIAAIFRAYWLTGLLGSLLQLFFSFLAPLFGIFGRGQANQRLVPVNNYVLRAENGRNYTARLKGQLQGATPQPGDRVRFWGRPQHGILRVEGGINVDTNEPLSLPFNWAPLWLLLLLVLVAANVVAYFYLTGQLNLA